jgi:ribonuclease P protein component
MLAKRYRLSSPRIRLVTKEGKRIRLPWFDLIYLPNRDHVIRFACIVSTKVDKRSTVRHAIKRIVHDVIQEHVSSMAPVDLVFIAKSIKLTEFPAAQVHIIEELKRQDLLGHAT